jgi:hypothetical protein
VFADEPRQNLNDASGANAAGDVDREAFAGELVDES